MEVLLSLLGLGVTAFLAATLLPGGSELALAGLIAAGTAPVWALVAAASVGNIAGSWVNWLIGRGARHLVHAEACSEGRRAVAVQAAFQRAGHLFRRFGTWTLLFSWVPLIGDPLTLVAGASGVPVGHFLSLVAIGKIVRFVIIAVIAHFSIVG